MSRKKRKPYTAQQILDVANYLADEAAKLPEKSPFDRNPYDEKTVFKTAATMVLNRAGDKLIQEIKETDEQLAKLQRG